MEYIKDLFAFVYRDYVIKHNPGSLQTYNEHFGHPDAKAIVLPSGARQRGCEVVYAQRVERHWHISPESTIE